MSRKLLNLCLAVCMSMAGTAAWALSEVGGVYQIGTLEDLVAFAELVNGDNPTASAVLTADIDKGTDGTMIGRDGQNFDGTFDGQGHTITINTFSDGADGTALFRNVGARATIQNLKVQGTITTDRKYACGIAVWSRGLIRNCYVDVNVTSAMTGDATHGGIVGVAYQGAMIENCLAKFAITGAATQNCGGIVGWADGRTNIMNCLVISDGSSFDTGNGGSNNIARNDGNIEVVNLGEYIGNEYDKRPGGASYNNYVTQNWGTNKATTVVAYEDLADGRICYQLNNDQSNIAWAQEIGKDEFPVPAVFGGKQVYASASTGCDGKSEGELTFSNSGTVQSVAHQFDKFGVCQVCGCYNINGLERDLTDGSFLLKTADDIDLAEGLNRIQNGGWFTLKMADDITYIAEPGRFIFNNGNWFDGNFNGDGHQLTIEMSDMGSEASLFPNFSGTFENVIMHGTIETSGQYAGSVTAHTRRDRVHILNVYSDIDINTTHTGDNTTGGFIGIAETKTFVDNAIYAGNINGIEGTLCIAGFCGWSSGQTYYTNSAFLGTLNNGGGDSKNISRNPSNIVCDNVYCLEDYGYGDSDKFILYDNIDGVESGELAFFLNDKKEGLDRFYQKIGTDPAPLPIKQEGALVYSASSEYRCDGLPIGTTAYSNTPSGSQVLPPHQYEEGFCTVCEQLQEDFLTPVDGWFEISNGAELLWWSHYASKHLDANARLTDDIDMDGYSERWADVGTEGKPFYGNFDGQFHVISNLIVDKPETNGVGLIAVMNSQPSSGFGGLSDADARAAEGVYIKNVVLDETCSLTGHGYIGIVGMTAPWAGHVNIQGLLMCGDVTANGGPNASGVFGCVMSSSCHVTINNSGMVGNVYGPKENGSFSGWLGSYAEVTNCYAVGSVEGTESDDRYFARYGTATITNCYARYGTQVPKVSEEDFESGALAWRANGEQFRTGYWYQNIGEDLYPFPDPSHGTVIYAAEQYFGVYGDEELGEVEATIQNYEEEAVVETIATQSLLEEYQTFIEAIGEASTILELADALDALKEKKEEVSKNAAVYQAFIDKCEEVKAYLESHNDFEGEDRDALYSYLTESDEPDEVNTLGTYEHIVTEHTATAEEIQAETERVAAWLQTAISNGYMAGTDVSNLLSNADFTEGRNEKWTDGFATGTNTLKTDDPDAAKIVGVEAWNVTGDMYQTVEGMKPGYYLVGTHAAFRPSNNRYSTNYAAGIYANGIFNYFPTVIEDYVAAADTIDQVNCNLHGNGALDLAIYSDNLSTDASQAEENGATLEGYAAHGPGGIAAAANSDRYQVYTIAKVADDGKLTVGIKNPGTNYGSDWTGWTALQVTYLADEAASALVTVRDNMVARANTLLEYTYDEETAGAGPNYPEALKVELEEAVASVGSVDDETLIAKFSDLFQRIYEGKQAYLKLYDAASALDYVLGRNVPLLEQDEQTGEIYEGDEMLINADEEEAIIETSEALIEAYYSGSYSTEEALAPEVLKEEPLASIIAPQDEEGFYLVGTPKQLVYFTAIAGGVNYNVNAKLTDNISMKGISMQPINQWDYSYRGTFDGQGYAIADLYINHNSPDGDLDHGRTGLFNTLDQATVKNLKVTGDYYTEGKYLGGICGYAYGATIQNCEIDVNLHSSIVGDGTHGGVIGHNAGEGTVVENCLVNVNLLGEETNSCGGVCGWAGSTLTVRNTLILSSYTVDDDSSNTISRNDGNCTVSNVYYLNQLGGANGTKVTAEQLASGEIAYKLNGSKSEGDLAWFQTIGADANPLLFEGATVYYYGGQYINEKPNPQLNAFAYNLEGKLVGSSVVVSYSLNAEAESVKVNFSNGYTETVSAEGLTAGAHRVSVDASKLGADPLAVNYEVEVKGKGTLDVLKVGESYKFQSPYGLAVNNNPASKGFGQVLVAESRPQEDYSDMFSADAPGALFAFDAAFEPVGSFYGGLDIAGETPLKLDAQAQLDLKDVRFSKDGRLFVARAAGLSNSSVYELNPDNLDEAWTPLFQGGELDEATGITYVGGDEQSRPAVGLAAEGEGADLKLYVLGAQGGTDVAAPTNYNCAFYELGAAKEWTAAPSGYVEALDGTYATIPTHVGISEDGRGGLWFIQSTSNAEIPAVKHFNADGEEDYTLINYNTYSGKIAITNDGKYLAIPRGNNRVAIYETDYVPMANGSIYLNPVYNIAPTESRITGLAFDYAGNLYVASSGSKTLSRYAIPSWNDNLAVTPGNGITEGGLDGDLNGDGKVDIADAVSVLNIMAEDGNDASADINGDGKVDIADFVSILNIMAEQ